MLIKDLVAGDDVQVGHEGAAARIEQVFAGTAVAGTSALPMAEMGQAMLDGSALTRYCPAFGGLLALA